MTATPRFPIVVPRNFDVLTWAALRPDDDLVGIPGSFSECLVAWYYQAVVLGEPRCFDYTIEFVANGGDNPYLRYETYPLFREAACDEWGMIYLPAALGRLAEWFDETFRDFTQRPVTGARYRARVAALKAGGPR